MSRSVWWTWGRVAGSVLTLAVVVWRLGTGPFLNGLQAVDAGALAAAAAITLVTTVCSAWRWKTVAAGLGVELSLPAAVAAYYRAIFINITVPGGVVGDVHRGVSHGRDVHDVGRGLRAVAWERTAGQVVQFTLTVAFLLVLPSPVHSAVPLVALAAVVTALVIVLVARARPAHGRSRWARIRRAVAGDIRDALLTRRAWLGIAARLGDRRRRPHPHLPDRRADGRHRRATEGDAADRVARDNGHGAAQRRRLGAARGDHGVGVWGRRPGGATRGRRRGRVRHHGARRLPAWRGRARGGMVPS